MTLAELKEKLDQLSPVKVAFVARVVDSLSNPPVPDIQHRGTWITVSPEWMEYFSLSLSVHHSSTTEPMKEEAFETAFRNACIEAGWAINPRGSATQRFVDLEVRTGDGQLRRVSLKSTAAKRLSKTSAHISKLTEAAWVQDKRTAKGRRDGMRQLIREYQDAVDSIVMLRAFREEPRYQLLEIPASIFDSARDAPLEIYRPEAPVIPCMVGGSPAAEISIDRSDAKITIKKIQLSACVVHAEWVKHQEEQ
ncbi:MAG: hypothetical protein OXG37_06025 [Actinomycetia bacterium]|nr:hypothetical protein [Actinomycetes bacterium]